MKSLVVYYSLDNHTRVIADIIAAKASADILELKPANEHLRSGFGKYFWGGKSVLFNEKPSLLTPLPDLSGYDVIFIGTPIWASGFTPPVNTFLAEKATQLSDKRIMLFASHAGGGAAKCFDKIKSRLSASPIIGEIDFSDRASVSRELIASKIESWLQHSGITA